MRSILLSVRNDSRGAGAVEFALIAPAFILLVVAVAQLGILFFANAGLNNALAEGARMATLFPRPTEADIRTKIDAVRWGLKPENLATPSVTYLESGGVNYAQISMSYDVDLNFIFFELPPVTITQSRRAYIQPLPEA